MFDHVTITASDLSASRRFHTTVLQTLGIHPSHESEDLPEWEGFSIAAATAQTRHLHLGFVSPSRELVDEFWKTGVDAGFQDAGAPGPRPQYSPEYYGSFLLDPDGNSAEAGYRDHGPPGERPEYHPGYYAAYVLDPDGTNIESVLHERH